ncbi:MAG: hypothetical protein ACI8W8_001065 [Rhodothermales bacterium]|jgi:hypothetical protein
MMRFLICFCLCLPAWAANEEFKGSAELTIRTEPLGARIILNGVDIGTTPLVDHPIDRKGHMLEIISSEHEPVYHSIAAGETGPIEMKLDLTKIAAAVYFDSTPPGATVVLDGNEIGRTPFLRQAVPMGRHIAEFALPGHGSKTTNFRVENRRPLRLGATLSSVLSTLTIESDPEGASVIIGGVHRGRTPVVLNDLAEGRHEIRGELNGYHPVSATVVLQKNEHKRIDLPQFDLLPGSLSVVSTPDGADVYSGTALLGRTPLAIRDLDPGEMKLRIALSGYEPVEQTVLIEAGQSRRVEVSLEANFGGMALITEPPGCTIYLGEERLGVTMQKDERFISSVFERERIGEGPYVLTVQHPGYKPLRKRILIVRGEVAQLGTLKLEKLWVPDHELKKINGETVVGVLLSRSPDGTIEFSPTKAIVIQYKRQEYQYVRELLPDEVPNP